MWAESKIFQRLGSRGSGSSHDPRGNSTKPGRESKLERIINFNFGIVIHDVAVASVVLARAKEKGMGTKLDLAVGELPIAP